MSEGTIISYKNNSGQIRGDDGETYAFNRRALGGGDVALATPGRRVRFQPDGERARDVVLLPQTVPIEAQKPKPVAAPPTGSQPAQVPAPAIQPGPRLRPDSSPRPTTSGSYRFLNPYNFVRPLEAHESTAAPLLGRCAPPPHDRYVGLTGRITCKLTAVTPIFVSDSHNITSESVGGKEHLHYRFFRDPEGHVALPGTSLRGALRSIFEAVTNSCFANFAGDKRLSYHLPPGDALRLVPARVRINGQKWELELMPGTTPVTPNQRPAGPQYAAWVHTYRPLWASKTAAKVPTSSYAGRSKLALTDWKHKQPCDALIDLVHHPLRNFDFWNVVAIARPGAPLPKPTGNQRVVSGYLCITNQNIENKHDERLFFNVGPTNTLDLPAGVRRRYEELIKDYQERHIDALEKRRRSHQPVEQPAGKDPGFSRFIVHKEIAELEDGDLVYAMLEQKSSGFAVKYIVPVSVPRVGFERKIGQLLHPDDLDRCQEYTQLCPACRTFGWVWSSDDPKEPRPDLDIPIAYAGRVRISQARRIQDAGSFEATLAILSTPKPTTTRFYLRPKAGKPQDGLDDEKVGYNAIGQILRGRKVYRHHGARLSAREYQSVNGAKSDQNRTIHEVQNAGSVFEFTIDFENLAEIELGALLWTLEMEGWHHRIGFGKPLGFGSATIQVTHIEMLDTEARYDGLSSKETVEMTAAKSIWVEAFRQAMRKRFGKDFSELTNVRELRALLAETPGLPVHYPRAGREPQPEGKNYEWFVGNKRSGRDAGPRLVLALADEDRVGLPLIDKYGDHQF